MGMEKPLPLRNPARLPPYQAIPIFPVTKLNGFIVVHTLKKFKFEIGQTWEGATIGAKQYS